MASARARARGAPGVTISLLLRCSIQTTDMHVLVIAGSGTVASTIEPSTACDTTWERWTHDPLGSDTVQPAAMGARGHRKALTRRTQWIMSECAHRLRRGSLSAVLYHRATCTESLRGFERPHKSFSSLHANTAGLSASAATDGGMRTSLQKISATIATEAAEKGRGRTTGKPACTCRRRVVQATFQFLLFWAHHNFDCEYEWAPSVKSESVHVRTRRVHPVPVRAVRVEHDARGGDD